MRGDLSYFHFRTPLRLQPNMAAKRKASAMAAVEDDDPVDPSDELVFTGLGGCQEVGRSCHILQYKGKTIMV